MSSNKSSCVITIAWLLIILSFILAPLSDINLLASLPELARPVLTISCTTEIPPDASSRVTSSVGNWSPEPPRSKTSIEVFMAVREAYSPWSKIET